LPFPHRASRDCLYGIDPTGIVLDNCHEVFVFGAFSGRVFNACSANPVAEGKTGAGVAVKCYCIFISGKFTAHNPHVITTLYPGTVNRFEKVHLPRSPMTVRSPGCTGTLSDTKVYTGRTREHLNGANRMVQTQPQR